jgi:hypothetical protein
MTADVSQDRRVTVPNRGHKSPALTEGSRLCWALPSPVHERSGYRASRPTGYKVMRSFRIVIHGPVLASRLVCHRARCGRAMIAPRSSRSRPLTRRLRRWPSASLDRASLRRKRAPPTNDALLTTYSPYKVWPRPFLRNGVTAYGALSLGTGLSCPHRPPIISPTWPQRREARTTRLRCPHRRRSSARKNRTRRHLRPSQPAARSVTIGHHVPLDRGGMARSNHMFLENGR